MKARAWRLAAMAAGAPLLYDRNVVAVPFRPSFRSPDRSQNHDLPIEFPQPTERRAFLWQPAKRPKYPTRTKRAP